MARRSSSQTGGSVLVHSKRPTNMQASVTGETIVEGNEEEGQEAPMTPEELEQRMASLLHTCTYTVRRIRGRGLGGWWGWSPQQSSPLVALSLL